MNEHRVVTNGAQEVDPLYSFHQEIRAFLEEAGVPAGLVSIETPPDPTMGEAAANSPFLLARDRRMAPRAIAEQIAGAFHADTWQLIQAVEPAGAGFINFRLRKDVFVPRVLAAVQTLGSEFGRPILSHPGRLLIEHTSVNPNKEWHVGHLRNAVLGDVLARVAKLAGSIVEVQNYIDDTGRQAAEAMYALELYEAGAAPAGTKFDEFVGQFYIRLNGELNDESTAPERKALLEQGIERVLHELEEGRHRVVVEAIVQAQLETAHRLGVGYDMLVWESDIVRARLLEEALELLQTSEKVFTPDDGEYAGALVIRLAQEPSVNDEAEPQLRVLVRSNGLPTYTGKDVAYMLWKFGLLGGKLQRCSWAFGGESIVTSCPDGEPFHPSPPSQVINVVGEHQALQQRTVIEALAAAGFAEQAQCAHHLSYGMVSQVHGRISGRKGSGIAADAVLDEASAIAADRVGEKQPGIDEAGKARIAEAVAVGAVRYLMVQYSPVKPIVFDLADVVSFEGNTALYIQYALVRMAAVLRRARAEYGIASEEISTAGVENLVHPSELRLVLALSRLPSAVADTLRTLSINLIAEYAHTIAAEFSQFYRDCPVLSAEADVRLARLRLMEATQTVLANVTRIIGIPVVERL